LAQAAVRRGFRESCLEQFLAFLLKSPFHMLLFGLAVTTGGMLLWPLLVRPFRRGMEVEAFEAVQLINRRDAVVLDVRSPAEFASGHIAAARHIPESQLLERMKEIEKFRSRPIIVSCNTGTRATAVCAALRKLGFAEAFVLRGGLAAWRQAGLPLEK
jgi:rhodanese-related sulfurtransferase